MKTPRFYLEHIREQTRYLMETSAGVTKEQVVEDRTLTLAFERSLEIIGEAVAGLDDGFKEAHPDIPWRKIRALRNVVAHMYWSIDYDIIWNVISVEIPVLDAQTERLLRTLP